MPLQRLPIVSRLRSVCLRSALCLISLVLLLASSAAFAQVETILHDFIALPHGGIPESTLIADSAGNLYGTTEFGGTYGYGTIFKLSANSSGKWTETILYNFESGTDGSNPVAGLTFDSAGNLYGTTSLGPICVPYCGYEAGGAVFKLSPNSDGSWSLTVLHTFNSQGDGAMPLSGVVLDGAGNVYGTTYQGGSGEYGTIYELSPSGGSWTETILYNFTDEADGGYPFDSLTFDKAGNLYGTASVGGDVNCENYQYQPIGCGLVFEFIHNSDGTWTESVLHTFEQYDGLFPQAPVIFDSAGNLYGTTENGPGTNCGLGCGTVFKMTPGSSGWTLKTVYTFAGGPDGEFPSSGLVMSSDGHFYGTTSAGGSTLNCQYGCGTVYQLTPSSTAVWKEQIIHNFSATSSAQSGGIDGSAPMAAVTFDQFGNLYGTASAGGPAAAVAACVGAYRCGGTAFKMTKNSSGQWVTSLLYSFTGVGEGSGPGGALISDSAGNLYGTTEYGGVGNGIVFELMPQSSGGYKERVIHTFLGGTDGSLPIGGLTFDSAGNLYGTTYYGGANSGCTTSTTGCGTVYELSPSTSGKWTETILHAFADADGTEPAGDLIMDSHGNLFGTAGGNSQGGAGTVFELSPSGGTWSLSVLYTFNTGNIYGPGSLIMDSSGNIFGLAGGGERGAGAIIELSPGTSGYTLSVLHQFAGGTDGSNPGGLAFDKAGNIVGVTEEGGNTACEYGCGTVFELAKVGSTWQKRTIFSFAGGVDASYPFGSFTIDSSGNLYGSSWGGGSATSCSGGGCGTVYKLSESAGVWTDTVLYSFGSNPFDAYRTSPLLWNSANILYGTGAGGDDGNGAAFQIDLNQAPKLSAPPPAQPHMQRQSQPQRAASLQSAKGGN
jgi:uncharacterized repeat protein (TIGR03803 family)